MENTTTEVPKMMDAPDLNDISLSKVLYALSDENRLKIVLLIQSAGGEMRCGSFAEKLGISKPTCSHHFGILRETGVILTRLDGTTKHNKINAEALNARFPGLLASVLAGARGLI